MQDNRQDKTAHLVKAFGEIVEAHRKSQGKTIYKISAEASLPKATWREIECGLKNFRFATLWKIAEGLDIAPAILMEELSNKLGKDFTLSDFD